MAKVVRVEEKAILTLAEKRILEKAYRILDDIYEECREEGDLDRYVSDAKMELEAFLDAEELYEVESENEDTVKIIIEL